MRTDMLLGVRFVTEPKWKKYLLEHFTYWKSEKQREQQQRYDEFAKSIGAFFRIGEEELREELAKKGITRAELPDFSAVVSLLNESNCRHYFIARPVIELCRKIRVKEPFDLAWLDILKEGKKQLNFGDRFLRYEKKGDLIVVLGGQMEKLPAGDFFQYSFFNFDLAAKKMSDKEIIDDYESVPQHAQPHTDFDDECRKLFFQLVTFLELSNVQEITVPPGRKHGYKKDDDNLINKEKFPITIVNSNWNKIIRTKGFDVNGHFRKQPYGPGRQYRRLIWIDAFHKNGYNLNAGKLDDEHRRGLKR